ncbi:MAG TPA: cupin domain-containing protein [Hansschlegelia sp.]
MTRAKSPDKAAADTAKRVVPEIFEILTAAEALEPVALSSDSPPISAMRAMRMMGRLGDRAFGVVSFSGQTGWERHLGEEFLYYLEGEAELRVVANGEEVRRIVRAGEAALVPEGQWHSQRAIRPVRLLFITPDAGTERSGSEPKGLRQRLDGSSSRNAQPPEQGTVAKQRADEAGGRSWKRTAPPIYLQLPQRPCRGARKGVFAP